MRQGLKYAAVLIGIYLAVEYNTGSTGDIKQLFSGGAGLVKAFQGR